MSMMYLEEAEDLIPNMNIRSDDVIWKALLGACKMLKNIEVGRRAAEVLMQLASHDSGAYVALSNTYAAVGDWGAVAEVRLKMKDLDIRKDPGCSWIEIDGATHEFVVEDDSQPRAREIHSMLKEISHKLSLEGHRPDTTQVLLNKDEEPREFAALPQDRKRFHHFEHGSCSCMNYW
ncbi:hypothetical protein K1719_030982 [Acacia pycnantha]|nr:hypothetical protein K1719_030982 [Acacia pycnantha]